jgi:arylsulfatase
MPEALCKAGYATHGIGKLHFNNFGTAKGIPPQTLDPKDWPESRWMWENKRITRLPLPYYGLETVDYIGGHGTWTWGDYLPWLLEREPQGQKLLSTPVDEATGTGPERVWRNALPPELHYTSWMADRAIGFIERQAGKRPFFLWCSFPDPHFPFTCAPPWCDMYRPEDMPPPKRCEGELESLPPHYKRLFESEVHTAGRIVPTNVPDEQIRRVHAMVCGMIGQIDHNVGRVLAALERLGVKENTCVVFMADHGQMLGDHWMLSMPPCHLDGTLRVPSLWRLPSRFRAGLVSDALVSHLDFAPTILDLAGVPVPEGRIPAQPEAAQQLPPWPGRSIVPLLTGQAHSVQDSVIAENDEDYLGMRMRTLITKDYHMTVYAGQPYGELFDLRNDPDQLQNLWDDPNSRSMKRDLQTLLLDRLAATDNVLPRRLSHA